MNILQYKTVVVEINGKFEGRYRNLEYSPQKEAEEIFATNRFEDAWEYVRDYIPDFYPERGLFTNTPYLTYKDITLTKNNFKSIRISYEYAPVDPKEFSFAKLSESLPANEFVEWLKDHGLCDSVAERLSHER